MSGIEYEALSAQLNAGSVEYEWTDDKKDDALATTKRKLVCFHRKAKRAAKIKNVARAARKRRRGWA